MNPLGSADFDEHEHVSFFRDAATGLQAIVAIHSTAPVGIAGGGCRWWTYPGPEPAMRDALRLSRAMSYKLALVGLPAGGAKAVVLGGPNHPKCHANLRAVGRMVHRLAGRFILAEDVGTNPDDLDVIRSVTPFVSRRVPAHDTATSTAAGVLVAIRTGLAARARTLSGARVLVQGLGRVGWALLHMLRHEGCTLFVSELDDVTLERARQELGVTVVSPEDLLDTPVDVFAPCALGDVLSREDVARLRCTLVAGSANNPLVDSSVADELAARGILYCPDFIANAGGVIGAARAGAAELGAFAAFMPSIERIAELAREVFGRAERERRSTESIAVELAKEALARMKGDHQSGDETSLGAVSTKDGEMGQFQDTSSR